MTTNTTTSFPFADMALARRLEKTEARANAGFVEARAVTFPRSRAEWTEIAGAYAMYDGTGSPVTQTFGLGMFQLLTNPDLDALEEFFKTRGADVFHEVSPLADASVLALLTERGYQLIEFTNVLYRPITKGM